MVHIFKGQIGATGPYLLSIVAQNIANINGDNRTYNIPMISHEAIVNTIATIVGYCWLVGYIL